MCSLLASKKLLTLKLVNLHSLPILDFKIPTSIDLSFFSFFLKAAKYPHGRCFIRPSGTEDVIRVYAEAATQEEANSLANAVAKIADQFLGSGSS